MGQRPIRWGIVVLVSLLAMLMAVPAASAADHSDTPSIEIVSSSHFGRVAGVSFTRHECRFAGKADALDYVRVDMSTGPVAFDVQCSIVLPTRLRSWNGRLLVEPLDAFNVGLPPDDAEVWRDLFLSDRTLFGPRDGGRWGYANISYFGGQADDSIDQPPPVEGFPAASMEILSDFGAALADDGDSLFGEAVDSVAAVGLSNQGSALRGTLALSDTFGQEPFDLSLIAASGSNTNFLDPTNSETILGSGPVDFGTQKVLFVDSETEVIANGTIDAFGFIPVVAVDIGTEANDLSRFRYEIAGGSHLDRFNQVDIEEVGLAPPGSFDESNTLSWTPILRGLFGRMDAWLAAGTLPPPSRLIDRESTPTAPDPAYPGHPSVVNALVSRDVNLNATGGVRLPNVELGIGTYRAVGPPIDDFSPEVFGTQFFQWLAGGFDELDCEPLPDGGDRFRNHGHYVQSFARLTATLVEDGFLEWRDATAMIVEAARSDIGRCS
jgi:hypothetical protein